MTDIEGNTVQISSLHLGDSFFVLQDLYPNRWVSGINSGAGTVTLNSTRVDSGAGTVEDVTVNGSSVVQNNIAVLITGAGLTASGGAISLADNYGDTKNPYASKTQNYVLAAPSNANGAPTFRALTTADLANTGVSAGTYSAVTVNTKGLVTAGGQILEVINNGATPTVANGGWYFEKDA